MHIIFSNEFGVLGGNVILNCTVYGLPIPEIIWIVNGTTILFTDMPIKTLDQPIVSILTLKNINYGHAGMYECFANNSLNDSVVSSKYLNVLGKFLHE